MIPKNGQIYDKDFNTGNIEALLSFYILVWEMEISTFFSDLQISIQSWNWFSFR